jgi:hypothetical protein
MKNLTTSHILLIVLATILLILTAFSFYLLQDPTAPLPFLGLPPANTVTQTPASLTGSLSPTDTTLPTRQTSYTPFAVSVTPSAATPGAQVSDTPVATATASPGPTATAGTSIPQPSLTASSTATSTSTGSTAVPSPSPTLGAGEFGINGRILQDGTPVSDVQVSFVDDATPRQDTTNEDGHYWFITLAPGTSFTLSFSHSDNAQLTPSLEIASIAWIEGNLPVGVEVINLPDLDISLLIDDMFFELQTPQDGATYSAAAISPTNPIQFSWTTYDQGDTYFIELGEADNEQPAWTSIDTTTTNLMWNGTLGDGSHITEGIYWWRVGVERMVGNYRVVVFTPAWNLNFNP